MPGSQCGQGHTASKLPKWGQESGCRPRICETRQHANLCTSNSVLRENTARGSAHRWSQHGRRRESRTCGNDELTPEREAPVRSTATSHALKRLRAACPHTVAAHGWLKASHGPGTPYLPPQGETLTPVTITGEGAQPGFRHVAPGWLLSPGPQTSTGRCGV